MKFSVFSAGLVLVLPIAAMAQSLPQKKADLEEALRVQQFICNGIADVGARGSSDFSSGDLVRCRAALEEQRAEYQRFMAEYASAANAPHPQLAAKSRTTFADAAH
jgi:hypothetical protein